MIDLHVAGDLSQVRSAGCDVCIIGTGPAGSTIARELSAANLKVLLLESGGFDRLETSDELDRIDNIGRLRADQWAVRNRIVGGSSHTWGGRCAPFDAIDFEERAWVPESGWPFQRRELDPYLERSAAYLGLAYGNNFSGAEFWQLFGSGPSRSEPDPDVLLPFFWQFSRDSAESYPFEYTRFGRTLAEKLGSNVTLVCGATVVAVHANEGGDRVRGVEIAAPDGSRLTVPARIVVMCAGGIENARLLLASDQQVPGGLGNRHDLVGRYLMDHLRGPVGFFDVARTQWLQRRFGRYTVKRRLFRGGLRLSPEIQRNRQLLNCAVWLGETLHQDDPVEALRRILGGKLHPRDVLSLTSNLPLLLRGCRDYFIYKNGLPRKLAELSLECMVEQRPDFSSRVTLSDQRDRFGSRLPRVDWRSHEDEGRTMREAARFVASEFGRIGFPVPTLAEWVLDDAPIPLSFVDVAHPTGTTRMSSDPTKGVVDARGQVHGVAGLYVAGSSVFPTAGHCNPTQMIVALAIRLAETLTSPDQGSPAVTTRPEGEASPGDTRVLVTGATGRIGRILIEDLLERGYRVRATTSRSLTGDHVSTDRIEWRRFDFMTDRDYAGLVEGCQAVMHLAAELGHQERMQTINVEATRNLAEASERSGLKAFCYMSSVAVYGSGRLRDMPETAEVLTSSTDVKSEYWALEYVRAYGRTKLAGEEAIKRIASAVPYVILRPTVVVDLHNLTEIRDWSFSKRLFAAHRTAHHVYVRDVTDAAIWAMRRGLEGAWPRGDVQVYNLSDHEPRDARIRDFMRRAYKVTRDKRFRVIPMFALADWLHDFLRVRTFPLRNPLWRMRFPNDRLRQAGYRHRYGMAKARELALESLRDEVRGKPRLQAGLAEVGTGSAAKTCAGPKT